MPVSQHQRRSLRKAKARALSRGDFRAARKIQVKLHARALEEATPRRGGKVLVSAPAPLPPVVKRRRVMAKEQTRKLGVPAWFRPGYDEGVRVKLWKRLSHRFRRILKRRHAQGRLDVYLPSQSYWAQKFPISAFLPASSNYGYYGQEGVSAVNGEAVVEVPEEAAVAAVVDAVQQAEAEQADSVEVEQIEPAGVGLLVGEDSWYDDPIKLFGATVVGFALFDWWAKRPKRPRKRR